MEGLALAQLAPGPLAAQLAIYLGWAARRACSARRSSALAFIAAVVRDGARALGAVRPLRRPAVDAGRVLRHRRGGDRDHRAQRVQARADDARPRPLLWVLFAVSAVVTAWTESEIVWLFLAAASWRDRDGARAPGCRAVVERRARRAAPVGSRPACAGPPTGGDALDDRSGIFAKAGAFVFGSGLAIVPFLHGGVVDEYHWLTERQFLDAVAVAMITPGPVVITVAFIGYLVAGTVGATVAAARRVPAVLSVRRSCPRRTSADSRRITQVQRVRRRRDGGGDGRDRRRGVRSGTSCTGGCRCDRNLSRNVRSHSSKTKRVPEPIAIVAAGIIGLLAKGVA